MENIIKYDLNGIWNLSFTLPEKDERIETTIAVPCNIEPKLAELGLAEDYMPADTEFAMAKFEAVDDWTYTKRFDAPGGKRRTELVFEGIDTIAEVYLNGEKLGKCENMYMTYRFDVTERLKKNDNELKVIIRSSELYAREHPHDMYSMSHSMISYYDSQKYLRKARHQWGWDNAPRLITSGIIRDVYLEEIPRTRFSDVYLYTINIGGENAELGVNFIFETDKKILIGHKIRLTLSDGGKTVYDETRDVYFTQGSFKFSVPRDGLKLWWPVGFGEPFMYKVKLELLFDGETEAEYSDSFGIRKIKLDRTNDTTAEKTGKFQFYVNGERVNIRGTNWKPLDPLASLADKKTRTLEALECVKDLNCNMVRIWGGGIYEDECFFKYCDENGILIWQDFMLACEIPPTDESYCRLVAAEAKQIITRYRNHPSLAVWCGDNENDECIEWQALHSNIMPSDSVISRKVLKTAVLHFDPFRDYVDSSPYATDENIRERAAGEIVHHQTENHLYPDVIKFKETLRDTKCFFIGETGPIRLNAIAVNERIYRREEKRMERLWNSEVEYGNACHQNDKYFTQWRQAGKQVCLHYFKRDFELSEWDEYTLAVNVVCAEVFKDAVEYCRISRPSKTGVLWWSLMDMWPMAFNYSVMDCDYNKKLPYHWIKQSQQDICMAVTKTDMKERAALYAINDTSENVALEYSVDVYDENGGRETMLCGTVGQDKNSVGTVDEIPEFEKPRLLIIRWSCGERTGANHYFTDLPAFETTREWVKIIGRECGFSDKILEIKQ